MAEALSLDMREWWTPTVEGFYQRLPKAALSQAVIEAKVSKAEAARVAARSLKDTGWLPEPLRMPSTALAA